MDEGFAQAVAAAGKAPPAARLLAVSGGGSPASGQGGTALPDQQCSTLRMPPVAPSLARFVWLQAARLVPESQAAQCKAGVVFFALSLDVLLPALLLVPPAPPRRRQRRRRLPRALRPPAEVASCDTWWRWVETGGSLVKRRGRGEKCAPAAAPTSVHVGACCHEAFQPPSAPALLLQPSGRRN